MARNRVWQFYLCVNFREVKMKCKRRLKKKLKRKLKRELKRDIKSEKERA